MSKTEFVLAIVVAALLSAPLVSCGDSGSPVNGLGIIPGGAYTPGSNMNPLSPGVFTGER